MPYLLKMLEQEHLVIYIIIFKLSDFSERSGASPNGGCSDRTDSCGQVMVLLQLDLYWLYSASVSWVSGPAF